MTGNFFIWLQWGALEKQIVFFILRRQKQLEALCNETVLTERVTQKDYSSDAENNEAALNF